MADRYKILKDKHKEDCLDGVIPLMIKDEPGSHTYFLERTAVLKAMDIYAKFHAELAFDAGYKLGDVSGYNDGKYQIRESDPFIDDTWEYKSKEEYMAKTFPNE